ncbi:MAG TPA: hypothetical protein VID48_08150 [Solirubrobacteraceae bacterium]|jgi:hypothetical protein
MPKFEDRLWEELVREHGSELASTPIRIRPERRRRVSLTAGALAGVAGAIIAILLLTAGTSPPVYAVSENQDGTVTVTINDLVGISGANAQLKKLGVRAKIAKGEPGCITSAKPVRVAPDLSVAMTHPSKVGATTGITINPRLIPFGDTLRIVVRRIDTHRGLLGVGLNFGLFRGSAPSCAPQRGDSTHNRTK